MEMDGWELTGNRFNAHKKVLVSTVNSCIFFLGHLLGIACL